MTPHIDANSFRYRLRKERELTLAHFALAFSRNRAVRSTRQELSRRGRELRRLVLRDLVSASMAHRLRFRAIRDYLASAAGGVRGLLRASSLLRGSGQQDIADKLAADCVEPPRREEENPLRGAREAAAYLVSSSRIRSLQAVVVSTAFAGWYGLDVSPGQAEVLGSFSDTAWLARGLMKSAGIPENQTVLDRDDRRRLAVVLEPYVRGLELRRHHLEGLSRPGQAMLASLAQKRRIGRLRRQGFAPDDLKVLYPDMLDRQTLARRKETIETLHRDALQAIRTRVTGRRFEIYLHLQTLTMGAPSRGPKRLGRYMAAVEQRHAA